MAQMSFVEKYPNQLARSEIDWNGVYAAISSNLEAHEVYSAPYYRWIADTIRPWLGCRVVEVGAGSGLLSGFLSGFDDYLVTDNWEPFLERLRAMAAGRPEMRVMQLDVEQLAAKVDELAAESFDTVFSTNLLEHIEDDVGAIEAMRGIVRPHGRVVNMIPAVRSLYGSGDRTVGHYRRYERDEIVEKMRAAGLECEAVFFFNFAGYLAWFVTNHILRKKNTSPGDFRLFNPLVPLFRFCEKCIRFPIGSNLVAVGRRSAAS
jgi:SAM-dependent methyltransferase